FYVDREAGGLVVTGMDGSGARVLVPLSRARGDDVLNFTVSPDGKQLALNYGNRQTISFSVIGVDGTGLREVYRKPTPGAQPVGEWSPDGSHFVGYISQPDGTKTLATFSVADGSVTRLRTDPTIKGDWAVVGAGGVMFSSDGKQVVYAVTRGTSLQSDIH